MTDTLARWRPKPPPAPPGAWWEDPNVREQHARQLMRETGLPLGGMDEEDEDESVEETG